MTKEYFVGSVASVTAGETTLVNVDGTEIALFMCEGQVVATQGQCPHAEGPLHEGEIEGGILTCPWHGWTFNLNDGHCQEDDSIELWRFPVRIDGDNIMVSL
ncbi:MAG: Rieske 2Fe-2S domain-containing protein [Novosphingobium sp.]